MIAFSAWISWRLSDVAGILDDTDADPRVTADEGEDAALLPDPTEPATADEATTAWILRNRKLYGALSTAMPDFLRVAIYNDFNNDGRGALD